MGSLIRFHHDRIWGVLPIAIPAFFSVRPDLTDFLWWSLDSNDAACDPIVWVTCVSVATNYVAIAEPGNKRIGFSALPVAEAGTPLDVSHVELGQYEPDSVGIVDGGKCVVGLSLGYGLIEYDRLGSPNQREARVSHRGTVVEDILGDIDRILILQRSASGLEVLQMDDLGGTTRLLSFGCDYHMAFLGVCGRQPLVMWSSPQSELFMFDGASHSIVKLAARTKPIGFVYFSGTACVFSEPSPGDLSLIAFDSTGSIISTAAFSIDRNGIYLAKKRGHSSLI